MRRDPIHEYEAMLRTAYGRPGPRRRTRRTSALVQAASFDDGSTIAARVVRSRGEYDVGPRAFDVEEYDVAARNPDFRPPEDAGARPPDPVGPPAPRTNGELARARQGGDGATAPLAAAEAAPDRAPIPEVPSDRPARTAAEQAFTQRQLANIISDDALRADLESILGRKPAPAAAASKTIDVEPPGPPPASAAAPSRPRPAAATPEGPGEHAIFDKIAENMRYATAYDLGSIDLQRRFDDFDRAADADRSLARVARGTDAREGARALDRPPPPPAAAPAPAEAPPLPHAGDTEWPPRPTKLAPYSDAERKATFGSFEWEPDPSTFDGDGIRILGSWEDEHIERVTIPQLVGKLSYGRRIQSGAVRFHRAGKEALVALWREWEEAGLLGRILSWEGAFAPRFIRGTAGRSPRPVSNHAWGTAFDVNAHWNAFHEEPALVGQEGCVRELVEIANRHGFYWGGHFTGKDGMHFELAKKA